MRRELGFRIGIGAFAVLLVVIVAAIGVELVRQSWLSISKFGLTFWLSRTWDPVAGEFGALPFIWGTLYSSILALLISTPIALGIAIFIAELCPARLQRPLVFLTVLLAAVRGLERLTPESWRQIPLLTGPPFGVGMLAAGVILAIMVIPFTSSV